MGNESGGWSGPAWADVWTSAAEIERQLRCRVTVVMAGSKVIKRGAVVQVQLARQMTRARWGLLAQVDAPWPSRNHKTVPSLIIALLYQALEAGMAFDARPYAQQRLEELPLPPAPEE